MNFLKRALLSIKRKAGKSLLLFLIIFILCNVIAGAVAIQLGTENVERNIKESLGAVYSVQTDHDAIMEAEQELQGEGFDYTQLEPVTEEIINAIGQSSYVKVYDYNVKLQTGSETVDPFYPPEAEEIYGPEYVEQMNEYVFRIHGVHYAPVITIAEGKERLVEGRVFTDEDIQNGANVAIINKKLADQNSIALGDDLLFSSFIRDWENSDNQGNAPIVEQLDFPVTVIGIYENVENPASETGSSQDAQMDKMMKLDNDINRGNTIYMPNKSITEFNDEVTDANLRYTGYEPTPEERERMREQYQPIFILNSFDDAENFVEDSQAILPEYQIIISNDSSFQQIAGPLQQTSKLASYVLYVAIGATLLIITLVVLLFLRDRKHELGICMSLGEKKGKILTQILAEVLLVALIAVTLSVFTGNLLATTLSDSMVKDRLVEQEDGGMVYWGDDWTFGQFTGNVSRDDLADNYSIKLTPSYIGLIYLIGLGSVLVATVIPMIYIMRLNPKKVLM